MDDDNIRQTSVAASAGQSRTIWNVADCQLELPAGRLDGPAMNCRGSSKVCILPGRRVIFPGLFAAIAIVMITQACSTARAESRVALVIGNSVYQNVSALPNPVNDASDISDSLKRLGFDVKTLTNANFDEMRRGLLSFGQRARGAEFAVIFFAGHGMEIGGENWVIPVDAQLASDLDVANETIGLQSLMRAVSSTTKLGLVILDACRNNPFLPKMQQTSTLSRAIDRGFARVEPNDNVLVAFAARDGTTANDGTGRNSPFTSSLLRNIETPGLEITFLFRNIRDDVMATTKREQQPFVYGSLSKDFVYLKPPLPVEPVRPMNVETKPSATVDAGAPASLQPGPPAAFDQADENTELKDTKLLIEVRERLYELNFDPGPPGGGRPDLTRAAIAQFARMTSTTLREEPTYGLLRRLRAISGPKPWGAIVYGERVNVWGMSWDEATRKDAVAHAAASCGSNAAACVAETSFFGTGCAAFAHSRKAWALVARSNIARAKSDALEECSRKSSSCNIIASVCADGTEQFTAK
jgi:hypothetical protein